ncbi:hypothetical protein [Shimia thalassica]|uniref:hypothetical protein n=1 Tax=Shimia thalassica TaxID=1715693 RepID=UPI002736396D|nr:hypothetical protein [Shimia thalassica]MDP2520805.1 hypothetical protein [Shimia thalassica]
MIQHNSAVRLHGETVVFGPTEQDNGPVNPYREIAPGFTIGFEEDSGVEIERKYEQEEQRLLLDVKSLGETRWLTFEFEVSTDEFEQSGLFFWSAVMSTALQTSFRLEMRIWSDDTFEDFHVNQFVADATPRKIVEIFHASQLKMSAVRSRVNRMTLILILPLSPNVFAFHSYLRFPSG